MVALSGGQRLLRPADASAIAANEMQAARLQSGAAGALCWRRLRLVGVRRPRVQVGRREQAFVVALPRRAAPAAPIGGHRLAESSPRSAAHALRCTALRRANPSGALPAKQTKAPSRRALVAVMSRSSVLL